MTRRGIFVAVVVACALASPEAMAQPRGDDKPPAKAGNGKSGGPHGGKNAKEKLFDS